jgi:hypothetical protein
MDRFQNNPSIGLVHPKSTHVRPSAQWGNTSIAQFEMTKIFIDAKIYIIFTCFENKKPSHLPPYKHFTKLAI